jgi:hypothetical protein
MLKIKIIKKEPSKQTLYMREYRKLEKHKEYQANYMKTYQQKNKEKLALYKAEYHEKNKKIDEDILLTIDNMNAKLKQLVNGHRLKDKKKGLYDEENFIDRQWVVDTINKQEKKCYYCKDIMSLNSNISNDKQLSIERVDNTKGHTKLNCVFSCLQCNLLTRYMTHDEFIEYVKYRTEEEGKRTCKTCLNHFDMSSFKHGNTTRMTCLDCFNKDRREKKKAKPPKQPKPEELKRTCKSCNVEFDKIEFKSGNSFRMNCKPCYNKDRREKRKLKN